MPGAKPPSLPRLGGGQLALDNGGWQTVAPSALAFHDGDRAPKALSHDDLARLKQAFVDSARANAWELN